MALATAGRRHDVAVHHALIAVLEHEGLPKGGCGSWANWHRRRAIVGASGSGDVESWTLLHAGGRAAARKELVMQSSARVHALDQTVLTPVVRHALRSTTVELTHWSIQPLKHLLVNPTTGGLYRVAGRGRDSGRELPWSVVLKLANAPAQEPQPAHWNYWKREYLAYQSRMLDRLPGPLAAPRCLGVAEYADQGTWIWLEDLGEGSQETWSLPHYAQAAYQLARFNGAYLTQQWVPDYPWLNPGLLRQVVARDSDVARVMDPSQPGNAWENGVVDQAFSAALRDKVLQIWADAAHFVAALDQLPQTLCHNDAHRQNLMLRRGERGQDQVVAVDWAFVGRGALGEDLADLTAGSIFWCPGARMEITALEAVCFEGYLAGLQDVGWQDDPRLVRLAYTIHMALRRAAVLPLWIAHFMDDRRQAEMLEHFGLPAEDVLRRWVSLTKVALERAAEARQLIHVLR